MLIRRVLWPDLHASKIDLLKSYPQCHVFRDETLGDD
jgi:hypothetical protein